MGQVLQPTHDCFEDAMRFIFECTGPTIRSTLSLVHGISRAGDGEHPWAHAWVEWDHPEHGRVVTQSALLDGERVYLVLRFEAFYEQHKIEKYTRYSFVSSLMHGAAHDNSGPWLDEYIALCAENLGPEVKIGGEMQARGLMLGIIYPTKEVARMTTLELFQDDLEGKLVSYLFLIGEERARRLLEQLAETPDEAKPHAIRRKYLEQVGEL